MEKVQLNRYQEDKIVRVWHKVMGTPYSRDTKASDCLAWLMASEMNRSRWITNQVNYRTNLNPPQVFRPEQDPALCAINGIIPKPAKRISKPRTRRPHSHKEPLGALKQALEAAGYKGSFAVIKIK